MNQLQAFNLDLRPLPGALPAGRAAVDVRQLRAICEQARTRGGRLVALWGSDERQVGKGFGAYIALALEDGLLCLVLTMEEQSPLFPDISDLFPAANRMQRAMRDLLGIGIEGTADGRRWLRHGAWPADAHPLRRDFDGSKRYANAGDEYRFVPVAGDGVHEIPVGPVHAGTIEPGHFRFQVVGERILRLEERLGYKHKGIEKRFEGLTLEEGARLAGRISGDTTVAYAWAYAMAVEGLTQAIPPERALWLRALFLERERCANHLGDLGALGNDAALAFGLAQFSRFKEDMLRTNQALFGHRYLMDLIIPGGVRQDLDSAGVARIAEEVRTLEQEVRVLQGIYDEHAGLQDRFLTTGRIAPALAARLGVTGLAGRASGQGHDLRVDFPPVPYDRLGVRLVTHNGGDVAARVAVRFAELMESLRLLRLILDGIPDGPLAASLPNPVQDDGLGLGWVEGWRGDVLFAIQCAADHRIRRAHAHDPSWQNWPALEYAVLDNIVPDFPLINKSFNLSYSGHDL